MGRITLVALLAAGLVSCQRSERWEDVEKRAAAMSDGELKELVERLFTRVDRRGEAYRTLMAAEKRAVPYLIRALDDPRTWKMTGTRDPMREPTPFERIAGLLRDTAPPEAARPLTRYMDHPETWVRTYAGAALATIGTSECVEPVKKALADREQRVRQWTLDGLIGGMRKGRRHAEFLMPIFDALTPMLKEQHPYDEYGPAMALAWIDILKAAPILESPDLFTTRNPQLEDVLKALGMSDHKTPLAILTPLMQELVPAATTNHRRAYEFAAALRLYAHNPDADSESTFRGLLNSPSDTVAEGAGWALEDLAGVNTERVMDLGHGNKFATMTPAQRYYYAVSEYHFEVCNGGHDQFFRNPSGDLYPTALEGLRAMGARTKADILQGALHAFGFTKVSLDQGPRQEQVATLIPAGRALLDRADEAYYESEKRPGERIEVLMSLFAVANRKDF